MRTATPNDVYTQQGAKPACQEDTNAKFSHLLLAQLPRTQFTHSKLPNPNARKTATQNFRTSYWHSSPEHSLHTASCQTRMPGRHQRKIFAPPIGAAAPNTVYTQQGAKPACQEDTNAKFSHLLSAQLPRTQFTHSKAPNPNARKTSPQYVRISYWQGYPQRRLHTANSFTHSKLPNRGPAATRRAATLSRGSEHCACHTDTTGNQQRPGAPQPFLEAPSTAHCACHTNRSRGPAATRRTGSEYCACHQTHRNPF